MVKLPSDALPPGWRLPHGYEIVKKKTTKIVKKKVKKVFSEAQIKAQKAFAERSKKKAAEKAKTKRTNPYKVGDKLKDKYGSIWEVEEVSSDICYIANQQSSRQVPATVVTAEYTKV